MMGKFCIVMIALGMSIFWSASAEAHGGGLNSQGCHRERATGGYHCHRSASKPAPAPKRQSLYSRPSSDAFPNCAAARAAGAAPVRRGDPGYGTHLDRDGDGVGCESGSRYGATVEPSYSPQAVAVAPLMSSVTESTKPSIGNLIIGVATALDGDTIAINNQRIRLHGVDAFEAEQNCQGGTGQEWGCGGVATRSLQEAVLGRTTICFPKDRDAYGRIVAICRTEGTDLSALQAIRGLAIAYRKYGQEYVADETVAKTAKVGAWYGTFTEPEAYRRTGSGKSVAAASRATNDNSQCNIKGNITSAGRRLYHLPRDPNYLATRQEVMFCSETEASAAGFVRPNGLQPQASSGVSVE